MNHQHQYPEPGRTDVARPPAADLLAELLARPPEPAPDTATPPPRRAWPHALLPSLRALLLALFLSACLGGLYLFGSTVLALATIHQNIQAMQAPTPAPTRVAALVPDASAADTADTADTSTYSHVEPTPTRAPLPTPTPDAGGPVNVLLLGIDKRPDETYPARTDAIVVAHINPERQRIALLSLHRDLLVQIPGYGQGRINSANVLGELYEGEGGGLDLSRRTVSTLLDIPIDHVVQVNFQGFIEAVDSIGGVTINVEKELYDPQFPTMDYGYTIVHFLPGRQHMDGEEALTYTRIRHPDSDFARMHRQHTVMVGILDRLRQQNVLGQVQRVAALTSALREYVQMDLPLERIVGLAWEFRAIRADAVERYVLDGSMVQMGVLANDPYAATPLPGALDMLVEQLLDGDADGDEPEL